MLNNTHFLSYKTFFSKFYINNPLEQYYSDFQSMIDGGLRSKRALSELKLKYWPVTGQENYQTWAVCGNKKTCVPPKIFCAGLTEGMLFLRWKLCKRWLIFTTIKELTCLSMGVLCKILQVFVFIGELQQSFIPSQAAIRFSWRNYVKAWLVDHP